MKVLTREALAASSEHPPDTPESPVPSLAGAQARAANEKQKYVEQQIARSLFLSQINK